MPLPTTREEAERLAKDWLDPIRTHQMNKERLKRGESPKGVGGLMKVIEKGMLRWDNADIVRQFAGPLTDVGPGCSYGDRMQVLLEHLMDIRDGKDYLKWVQWQEQYGDAGMATNLVIPKVQFGRDEISGEATDPYVAHLLVLSHPDDCERIARIHVRKQPNFTPIMFGSVISTMDNDHWRNQRENLVTAFSPTRSLAEIFPISVARASKCADILDSRRKADLQQQQQQQGAARDARGGAGVGAGTPPRGQRKAAAAAAAAAAASVGVGAVDMNDFCLHETQAQLQLALFGEDEEFMEATNDEFRAAMGGFGNPAGVRKFLMDVVDRINGGSTNAGARPYTEAEKAELASRFVGPAEAKVTGKPVKGPLSAQIRGTGDAARGAGVAGNYLTQLGNAMIFEFAGHDTTGHTLTWLTFELSRQPKYQERLIAEVDQFWKDQADPALGKGRPLVYTDLKRLPFMTRCITETLRLWPAVCSGTYRQLQFDDYVKGPGGKDVKVPRGTFVQIANWARHRNPDLWGADCNVFNPDREFLPNEIWNDEGFRAYNPHSRRFSPFTHPPRDCIGKNFAQMEMRTILCHVLRRFRFELTAPLEAFQEASEGGAFFGVNIGTMGPKDVSQPEHVRAWGMRGAGSGQLTPPVGMRLKVVPRQ